MASPSVSGTVGLFVETFGTDGRPGQIEKGHRRSIRPAPPVHHPRLNLVRPIYAPTAATGTSARTDVELPWGQLDRSTTSSAPSSVEGASRRRIARGKASACDSALLSITR